MSVCEDGADVLFVCCCYVFLGVSECSVCECSDDVQPFFGFCVNSVCVLFERHPSVECNSKDGGCVGDWDGSVVDCDVGLCGVF